MAEGCTEAVVVAAVTAGAGMLASMSNIFSSSGVSGGFSSPLHAARKTPAALKATRHKESVRNEPNGFDPVFIPLKVLDSEGVG